ncbi:spore cortex biosynthesis protein YabQ [Tumebacillus algifaecis]|uniref:Spore cortex biosynthesis protein YabQ n=1 Tax=Tumebacillus algifaecis TaxID=1214604 RepID=A0A223D6H2_9BACL|nr:spore cortex biosynthesis protein YabQ [Tumebacillus algifaecis]ASS76996.1 spore cortex biosynthesis protein YabQ [Tumebacillus algifaecis]
MSLYTQYLTILAMSLSGAVLGAVYDVYRTILQEWKYLRWTGPILDFTFWVFALILVLWSLHEANHADVRFYVFILLGIGLVLYRLLLRKLVVGSTVGMVLAITYFMKLLYRLFLLFVVTPLVWIGTALLALWRMIDRMAAMIERLILWPFQPLLRMVSCLGRTLYRWTIRPLIEPMFKPLAKMIETWLAPLRKFSGKVRRKWKGFLRSVAKWLVDKDQDDNNIPPKR